MVPLAQMSKADPEAIWLMQGWLFQHAAFWKAPQIEAYLGGVGKQEMWLLDLFGDSNPIWIKTASFYGHRLGSTLRVLLLPLQRDQNDV